MLITICTVCQEEVLEEDVCYDCGHHDIVCFDCCQDLDREPMDPEYFDDFPIDGVGFADPGGNSALRAETEGNPRNLPCPNCGEPNRLTPIDKMRGYQCDSCANLAERGGY